MSQRPQSTAFKAYVLAIWAASPAGQFGQQLATGLDGLLKSARGTDLNR